MADRITIGSNTEALRSIRLLAKSSETRASAMERLSSGQRINKASDDAAGLAISSDLEARTRVYTQAIRNVSDGISALSIADGAIQNLATVVERQRELAAQSANGVYSSEQRRALDNEAQALALEFGRIVATTSFNGVNLIDGSFSGTSLQFGYGKEERLVVSLGQVAHSSDLLQGDGTFDAGVSYQTGSNGLASAIADFNGDGILDIADNGDAFFSVVFGSHDGSFGGRISVAGGVGSGPYSILALDIDNDGDTDIVRDQYSSIEPFLNSGNGTFTPVAGQPADNYLGSLSSGDFNNDGNVDIFGIVPYTGNTLNIFLGNGNGTFASRITISAGAGGAGGAVAVGDFNNDGNDDLIYSLTAVDTIHVALGNGNSTFQASISFTTGGGVATSLSLADVDSNGNLDIVYSSGGTAKVALGNGTGTFGTEVSFATAAGTDNVTTGDVDGDGRIDIVAASSTGNTISILTGTGSGTFNAYTSLSAAAGAGGLKLSDLNGDGPLDIVSSDSSGYTAIFYGNGVEKSPFVQDNFTLRTVAGSRAALDTLAGLGDHLAKRRGEVGAQISRLDVTQARLRVLVETNQTARSRIVDADIAQETAVVTAATVLQQAGAAVLAQAKSAPELALILLRG